jgi:hypothetical protein
MSLYVVQTPKGTVRHLATTGPLGTGAPTLCGRSTGINAAKIDLLFPEWDGRPDGVCAACCASVKTNTTSWDCPLCNGEGSVEVGMRPGCGCPAHRRGNAECTCQCPHEGEECTFCHGSGVIEEEDTRASLGECTQAGDHEIDQGMCVHCGAEMIE